MILRLLITKTGEEVEIANIASGLSFSKGTQVSTVENGKHRVFRIIKPATATVEELDLITWEPI